MPKKTLPLKLKQIDFEDPQNKKAFNQDLFTKVSRTYDLLTKVLSFGRDQTWKRTLIALLPDLEHPVCLDLACGTGDITFLLARR